MNTAQIYNLKETVRGGRLADIPAHSIQCCDWPTWQNAQIYNFKETVRGGRVAAISAHSIQCCDWLTCIHENTIDIHEHYTFTQMYAHRYIHIKSNYLTKIFDENFDYEIPTNV